MPPHDTLFTPTEAAVLTGLPLKAVNNAIDKKTVTAVASEGGGRLLDARALLSLSIERRLADGIAPELRRKIFDAWRSAQAMSLRSKAGCSKLIFASRGARWRDRCATCAKPGGWWLVIPKYSAASRCSAARACLST